MHAKWRSHTVKQLQDELRKRGMKTGGRKEDLVERLEALDNGSKNAKRRHGDGHDTAIEDFGKGSPSSKRQRSLNLIEKVKADIADLFDHYKDPEEPDMITEDGMAALCQDLEVDPEDPVMLVLAWYMDAKTMCHFSQEEFSRGLTALSVSSIAQLKSKLDFLRRHLEEKDIFSKIYLFSFGFSLEQGQKSLSADVAIAMWELLFRNKFLFLKEWIEFVNILTFDWCATQSYGRKAISKDTWSQLLEFHKTIKYDLSNYDEEGAWPVMIDDFVSWLKKVC